MTEEERIVQKCFVAWCESGSMREKLREAVRETARVYEPYLEDAVSELEPVVRADGVKAGSVNALAGLRVARGLFPRAFEEKR